MGHLALSPGVSLVPGPLCPGGKMCQSRRLRAEKDFQKVAQLLGLPDLQAWASRAWKVCAHISAPPGCAAWAWGAGHCQPVPMKGAGKASGTRRQRRSSPVVLWPEPRRCPSRCPAQRPIRGAALPGLSSRRGRGRGGRLHFSLPALVGKCPGFRVHRFFPFLIPDFAAAKKS